ncbi:nucleoside hydrolase [Macrolepiota fuliginosa MF-IS2]|uniref:Nucleoside hydrolase n=1 Tax=Macrolepiota fuliginosa MF-IS2 TaxID=1400762 RepID=A0A9P5X889_9AGAR|nr:nucleoside hydrolase [Macrolepiota fuliginosa MF-IS2]
MDSFRPRVPVLIDTDPGVDDIVAILLALASPELDILALIVSFGNTDADASYLNILKLYQTIERHIQKHPEDVGRFPNFSPKKKIILARGCEGPIEGTLHSAQYFHGRDGLGDITGRHPDLNVNPDITQGHSQLEIADIHGVDIALDILRSYPPRSVTYVILGPMTNLVQMMKKDGAMVRERIGRIVCMGGALDVPGNTTPVAEFNFFADPYAVKELLLSDNEDLRLPLERFLMVPLDITTLHELPFPIYKRAVDPTFESASAAPSNGSRKSPIVHFTSSFLERTREVMLSYGKDAMELHDIVAVWCAMENPPSPDDRTGDILAPGWRALRRIFDIERFGELTRGMLVVDRRDDQTAYAPGANRAEVQKQLDSLGVPHGPWESIAVPAQVEVEREPESFSSSQSGVWCVTNTPGPKALLQLLLYRVWGVKLDE